MNLETLTKHQQIKLAATYLKMRFIGANQFLDDVLSKSILCSDGLISESVLDESLTRLDKAIDEFDDEFCYQDLDAELRGERAAMLAALRILENPLGCLENAQEAFLLKRLQTLEDADHVFVIKESEQKLVAEIYSEITSLNESNI